MYANYDIKKQIGEGTSSRVYLGHLKKNRKGPSLVAIKKIRPIATERAFQEIEIMKAMSHPNVLKLYDHSYIDGIIILVLEYCNHGDLSEISNEALDDKTFVADIIRQLATGWQYIKTVDALLIHRDIKLQNILLHKSKGIMTAKIADFGFCMSGAAYSAKRQQLLELTICGSPLYMAPEMFKNVNTVMEQYDDRIDIWSMGIVFYKLLFGRSKHPIGNVTNVHQLAAMARTDDTKWQECIKKAFATHMCTCDSCAMCMMVDMTKHMLQVNRSKRVTWEDIFKHPFMGREWDGHMAVNGPMCLDYVDEYLYDRGDYAYTRVYVAPANPWKIIGL